MRISCSRRPRRLPPKRPTQPGTKTTVQHAWSDPRLQMEVHLGEPGSAGLVEPFLISVQLICGVSHADLGPEVTGWLNAQERIDQIERPRYACDGIAVASGLMLPIRTGKEHGQKIPVAHEA